MGGSNSKQKQNKSSSSSSSSSYSISKVSKSKRSRRVEDSWDDSMKAYKVWPSDEDRGRWVAEPGIDRKASAYIAKMRDQYVSE